jgi:hypothetical protein
MLKNLSLVFILFLILAANANSKDKTHANEILPLKEGNWWRYSAIEYADTGKVVQDSAIISIGSRKKFGNQLWYTIELKSRESSSDIEIYGINKSDGFWLMPGALELGTNELISIHFFKYPTAADEKNIMNMGDQNVIIYTRQTDVKVEVPAGTFICIEYYAEMEGGIHFYACPGVGLIKMEGSEQIMGNGNDRKPGKKFALELMEYNVK